jgi:hypothetical protein
MSLYYSIDKIIIIKFHVYYEFIDPKSTLQF